MSDRARTGALSTPAHDVSRRSLASIGSIGTEVDGFAMRAEVVLRRVALGCAIFMLFGPIGGRTTWVQGRTTATDAAGYNAAAVLSGVVALAALTVALWTRPRVFLPVLGAFVAIVAFGLTAVASGVYVWARLQGGVWVYAAGSFEEIGKNETVRLAWGPPFFTLAALIGAFSALALAVTWLLMPRTYDK